MNRSKNGMRLSRRELLAMAGGFAASSIVTDPRPVLGGILDRLFHGKPAIPTAPITPNDEFYVTSYRSPPTVRVDDWRLSVTGLVERPLTLTSPAVGSKTPAIICKSVDLPAPLGPIRAVVSPCSKSTERSFNAQYSRW